MQTPMPIHDPLIEFDRQVARYAQLGYPALAGMDEAAFRQLLAPLTAAIPADLPVVAHGRIPLVIVIPGTLVAPDQALPLVAVRGNAGFVDMHPHTPQVFTDGSAHAEPTQSPYLMFDFDPGDELRNLAPSEAMPRILDAHRLPITIDEGVSAVVQHPTLLADRHCFSMLAARSDEPRAAKCVPALWISRGAPRLGWCWNGNPHSWLGSASCSHRAGF